MTEKEKKEQVEKLPPGFVLDELPIGFEVDGPGQEASYQGKRFTGESPDRPLFKEPNRNWLQGAFWDQLKIGVGDDAGKIAYLKKIGFEDVKLNKQGALVVKEDGAWKYFNRPGPSMSDVANAPGHLIVPAAQGVGSAVGFGLGAATLNPGAAFLGGVAGGAAGGAAGETTRMGLGLLAGTQSKFDKGSIGWATAGGGVYGGISSSLALARHPINPRITGSDSRRLYEIGKKIEPGLQKLKAEAGKGVAAEKAAVSQMKGTINTTELVVKLKTILAEGTHKSGASKFTGVDKRAIQELIDILSENHGRVSPKTMLLAKEVIDKSVDFSDDYVRTVGNVSSKGEVPLKAARIWIKESLNFHDTRPELGGTGGKLAAVNAKYGEVMKLYKGAQKTLGNDFTLSNRMNKIGEELVKDNPAYTDLFTKIDALVDPKSKFLDQLNFTVKGIRAVRLAKKSAILGEALKIKDTAGAAGGAVAARPAPKLLLDLGKKPLSLIGEKVYEPLLQGAAKNPAVPSMLTPAVAGELPAVFRELVLGKRYGLRQ